VLLTPTATDLSDPAVVTDADGTRHVKVEVPVADGGRTRLWLATLTADGIPSAVAGPYTLHGASVSGGG
jgi:hypothetical protein